jgi:hypothetical protein
LVRIKATSKVKGVRLVPYRLPAVLTAARVFVVEGEKDVQSIEKLGLVATCNAGGAGKWRDDYRRNRFSTASSLLDLKLDVVRQARPFSR